MWIRRSESEINEFNGLREQKRKSLLRPLLLALVWAGVIMISHYFGFRGGARGYYAISPQIGFSRATLFTGAFAFIVFFCLIYYRQKRGLTFFDSINSSLLCAACLEPSAPTLSNQCECGGRLEPFDYYTWNEPQTNDEAVMS